MEKSHTQKLETAVIIMLASKNGLSKVVQPPLAILSYCMVGLLLLFGDSLALGLAVGPMG